MCQADLLIGNNVLAHVPDLNDFVAGHEDRCSRRGARSPMEFPHLLQPDRGERVGHDLPRALLLLLVDHRRARLRPPRPALVRRRGDADARRLAAHLRLPRRRRARAAPTPRATLERRERDAGLDRTRHLPRLRAPRRASTSGRSSSSSIERRPRGQADRRLRRAGQGQHAAQLLRHRAPTSIEFTVDLNPHKQGRYLPGTHIPIRAPEAIREERPDFVLILPWNLSDEIAEQLAYVREWGGRFGACPRPRFECSDEVLRDAARRAPSSSSSSALERRARLVRAHVRRASASWSCGLDPRGRAVQRVVQHAARARCAACTSRRRRTARTSSCAACAARSST